MYYQEENSIFVRYANIKKRLANEVITFIDC